MKIIEWTIQIHRSSLNLSKCISHGTKKRILKKNSEKSWKNKTLDIVPNSPNQTFQSDKRYFNTKTINCTIILMQHCISTQPSESQQPQLFTTSLLLISTLQMLGVICMWTQSSGFHCAPKRPFYLFFAGQPPYFLGVSGSFLCVLWCFSSNGLGVKVFWRYFQKGWLSHSINM